MWSIRSIICNRDRWLSVTFFYNFYVTKTLNVFFSNQRFCYRRARFLKKFSIDYFQIFYVYSEKKYLWSDKAALNFFNLIIVKLTKKEQKKSIFEKFCLNCRHFVILQNRNNPLRHFRAMVMLRNKFFDLFLSDDADWGYRVRHGHAFFRHSSLLNITWTKQYFYVKKFFCKLWDYINKH